jgi:hypothetical protein
MGAGDISQMTYEKNCELCKCYSHGNAKYGKGLRDIVSKITRLDEGGVTKNELGNLLDNFKIDILISFKSQLDTMQARKKK